MKFGKFNVHPSNFRSPYDWIEYFVSKPVLSGRMIAHQVLKSTVSPFALLRVIRLPHSTFMK